MPKLRLKLSLIAFLPLLLIFSAMAQPPATQPVTAQPPAQPSLSELIKEAKALEPSQLPGLPPQIPFLGSDENINIHLRLNNGSETVLGVKLRDRKITEIGDPLEDWTLRVALSEKTLEKLMASRNPLNELRGALKSQEIKIQGRTFTKKVKAGILKLGLKLAGWFS